MSESIRQIRGVITALGTPLNSREDLHEEGMRQQIRMQLRAGVNGLLVAGSMGAMQLLKDETFTQAVAVAADEVHGQVPLIAGCGDTSFERTRARIRSVEPLGVDAVALVPPFFFRFSSAELLAYFRDLAGLTDLPVFLYDNPTWTKHSLDFDLVVGLSKTPNIVGLKASGDLLTLRRLAHQFNDSSDFAILSGQSPFFDASLRFGARGIVEGLFAVAPELGLEIWGSHQSRDWEAAGEAQRKLLRLISIVEVDSAFAGFTAAMNHRGIPGNFAPRPFAPITPEGREKVGAILRELHLI
jgi:4-hydroxy-tetrahydrodipicolinate synthase